MRLAGPAAQADVLSACRIVKGDNTFLLDLEGVFEKLKEKGASQEVSLYVEDLLVQQHQRYHNFMTAEADKRRRLLEHVQKLQVGISSFTGAPASGGFSP